MLWGKIGVKTKESVNLSFTSCYLLLRKVELKCVKGWNLNHVNGYFWCKQSVTILVKTPN